MASRRLTSLAAKAASDSRSSIAGSNAAVGLAPSAAALLNQLQGSSGGALLLHPPRSRSQSSLCSNGRATGHSQHFNRIGRQSVYVQMQHGSRGIVTSAAWRQDDHGTGADCLGVRDGPPGVAGHEQFKVSWCRCIHSWCQVGLCFLASVACLHACPRAHVHMCRIASSRHFF